MTETNRQDAAVTPSLEAEVGERIRALRTARGMSQAALGEALAAYGYGMPQPLVWRVETGRRPLRLGEVAAFAAALGVELAELVDGLSADDARAEAERRLAEAVTEAEHAAEAVEEARRQLDAATARLREANQRRTSAVVTYQRATARQSRES